MIYIVHKEPDHLKRCRPREGKFIVYIIPYSLEECKPFLKKCFTSPEKPSLQGDYQVEGNGKEAVKKKFSASPENPSPQSDY